MQVRGSIAAPCFLLLTPEMLSLENFGRSCIVQACHFQTLVRHVLFCTLCSLRGSGLVRLAFLLRRAAHCSALLLLNSPRPSAAMFGVVRPQAARTEGSKNLGGEVGDLLCDGRSYVADGRRGSL